MKTSLSALAALVTTVMLSSASFATPIYLDSARTQYVDFAMSVQTSIDLVPGQTGYVYATLTNNGNAAATFATWNPSFPSGGYGWDFFSSGWSLSAFSATGYSNYTPWLYNNGYGLMNMAPGYNPNPTGSFGRPDLSLLSNLTFAPGAAVNFIVLSFNFDASVPVGEGVILSTQNYLYLGAPNLMQVTSDQFLVRVNAANNPGAGPMQDITFGPATSFATPFPAPEPATLALVCAALAGVAATRRRRPATATD